MEFRELKEPKKREAGSYKAKNAELGIRSSIPVLFPWLYSSCFCFRIPSSLNSLNSIHRHEYGHVLAHPYNSIAREMRCVVPKSEE